jgi:hypothetical protein
LQAAFSIGPRAMPAKVARGRLVSDREFDGRAIRDGTALAAAPSLARFSPRS